VPRRTAADERPGWAARRAEDSTEDARGGSARAGRDVQPAGVQEQSPPRRELLGEG